MIQHLAAEVPYPRVKLHIKVLLYTIIQAHNEKMLLNLRKYHLLSSVANPNSSLEAIGGGLVYKNGNVKQKLISGRGYG